MCEDTMVTLLYSHLAFGIKRLIDIDLIDIPEYLR